MKKITTGILTAVLALGLFAAGVLSGEGRGSAALGAQTGSITVTVQYSQDQLPGAGIAMDIYPAALSRDSSGLYSTAEVFSGLSLEQKQGELALTEQNARLLAEYAEEQGIQGQTMVTDANGTAVFSSLTPGIYLVRQTGSRSSYTVSPALVRLPYTEGDELKYDVRLLPKTEYHPEGGPVILPVSVSVTKLWEDQDNRDGGRPSAVTVELYMDGVLYKTAELNELNGFRHTFAGLPAGFQYTVEEQTPQGYTAAYDMDGDQVVIVNTLTESSDTPGGQDDPGGGTPPDDPGDPENPSGNTQGTASVSVKKVWKDRDNAEGGRPEHITVSLVKGSSIYAQAELSEDNNWSYVFRKLPEEASYSVYEKTPDGYSVSYGGDAAEGFVITNTSYSLEDDPEAPPEPTHPSGGDQAAPSGKIPQTGVQRGFLLLAQGGLAAAALCFGMWIKRKKIPF